MKDGGRDPTQILTEITQGDPSAAAELLPLVYEKLRELAGRYMQHQPSDHTFQSTALVHEAYVKLVSQAETDWESRAHFFAVAARAMRQILVDHARRRGTEKRGKDRRRVSLVHVAGPSSDDEVDIIGLDEALRRLGELHGRMSDVVELKFFAGLTIEETALVLGVSASTIERDWRFAKAWLRDELGEEARL